jgi:hypothetical protein
VSGLNELRAIEDILDLVLRDVAADVLFLDDIPEARPFADPVYDVLDNPPLPLFLVITAAETTTEEPIPKRLSLLGHVSSLPLVVFPL